MNILRLLLIGALIAVAPVADHLSYFRAGRNGEPLGFNMLGADLFWLLIFPFAAAIAAAFIAPAKRRLVRVAFAIAVLLITPLLVLFAPPALAVSYARGFEHAINTDIGLDRLQQWSRASLAAFHQKTFSTTNAASYWSAGNLVIPGTNLPPYLKTGLFAPSGDPYYGPEISICTNLYGNGDCVAFCWYDHGLLVGSPQFKTSWHTYYCKQLSPGVYSYLAEK